jgi:hypothetical protein
MTGVVNFRHPWIVTLRLKTQAPENPEKLRHPNRNTQTPKNYEVAEIGVY